MLGAQGLGAQGLGVMRCLFQMVLFFFIDFLHCLVVVFIQEMIIIQDTIVDNHGFYKPNLQLYQALVIILFRLFLCQCFQSFVLLLDLRHINKLVNCFPIAKQGILLIHKLGFLIVVAQ